MDWTTAVAISVSVLLAFVGYFATYLWNLRLAQRKDRLDRVGRQLSEFYGPLYALAHTGGATWTEFRSKYRPGETHFWTKGDPPTDDDAATWRLWMTEVFMPINVEMVNLITHNADLLDEEGMPDCLLDVCAHVAAYRAVMKRWEEGDFTENTSTLNFPRQALDAWTSTEFSRLKLRQQKLLGR